MIESSDYPEAPIPRFVHGIFCEDVRNEVEGNSSFIGVFQKAVSSTAPYPFMMPKIAVVFWISCPIDDRITEFGDFFIEMPDGHKINVPSIAIPEHTDKADPRHKRQTFIGTVRGGSLVITQPGYLKLRLRCWGQMWTAASLEFLPLASAQATETTTSSPTASPPPSEQSPPAVPETKPSPARRRRRSPRSARTPAPE